MTEEEKKEFEEFLQWKKEKAEREQTENEKAEANPAMPEENNNTPKILYLLIAVALIVGVFMIVGTCSKREIVNEDEKALDTDSIAEVEEVVIAEPAEPETKSWDFRIEKDPMTDTNNIWASIESDDYVRQDFPYEGYTYAKITVRYMKKYGYDVLVRITKGQITGSSYNGNNYITARFDDAPPKKYFFDEAADGSSEMVFLRNKTDFISRCKKAKEIKIDLPLYKGGRPVFSFHVDEPLVWRNE